MHMQIMQQFCPTLASEFADPATHLLEVTPNYFANFFDFLVVYLDFFLVCV